MAGRSSGSCATESRLLYRSNSVSTTAPIRKLLKARCGPTMSLSLTKAAVLWRSRRQWFHLIRGWESQRVDSVAQTPPILRSNRMQFLHTSILDPMILSLTIAPGIGLLISTERERRKGEGPDRSPAGLRTFALASVTGSISFIVRGVSLLAITMGGIFGRSHVRYDEFVKPLDHCLGILKIAIRNRAFISTSS
jgi:hypothetical protein